jgi:type I restriction enzyme, S subunit
MSFKAYSAYKDCQAMWLDQIPKHWKIAPIKKLLNIQNGADHKHVMQESGYPVIGSGGVFAYASAYLYDGEAVLLGRKGTVNKPLYVKGKFWTVDTMYWSKIEPGVCGRFAYFATLTIPFDFYSTNTALPSMTKSVLGSHLVAIPPYEEQVVIASFLDYETAKIDALVQAQERMLDLLSEKRRSMMASAVCRGIDDSVRLLDSGVEWLGKVPAHWKILQTKRLFRHIAEAAPDGNESELLSIYTDIGVRPRKSLEERGNKASTTDGYWKVKKGDLIVNKLLAWMGAIGVSEYDGVTSPAYDILRHEAFISPHFYDILFRCGICHHEFKRYSRGIMEMRLRLYFEELGQLYMPCPPLEEQLRIVQYVRTLNEEMDKLVEAATRNIELLTERRVSLISSAVTGKIDVRGFVAPSISQRQHQLADQIRE